MNFLLLPLDDVAGSKLRGSCDITSFALSLALERAPVIGLESGEPSLSAVPVWEKKSKLTINSKGPAAVFRLLMSLTFRSSRSAVTDFRGPRLIRPNLPL